MLTHRGGVLGVVCLRWPHGSLSIRSDARRARLRQVPTRFACAFLSPLKGKFFPRLTRPLTGSAVVLHVGSGNSDSGPEWCRTFNEAAGMRRQMLMRAKPQNGGTAGIRTLQGVKVCRDELRVTKCPYAGGGQRLLPEDAIFTPPLALPQKLRIRWGEVVP